MVQTRGPKEKVDMVGIGEREKGRQETVEGPRLLWMVDGGLPTLKLK